jgi:acetyl-CoA carboxylase biotin carboxyl carrier protein
VQRIGHLLIDKGDKTLLNEHCFPIRSSHQQRTIQEDRLATPVTAPMVGKILKIEKNIGDSIDEDDIVLVMEAMKMEIPVVAPTGGVLKDIKVSPGQAVEADQLLAEIE